ncbi:hypothetical protein BRADI_4g07660v3 [Brachypodium distachyon]|uniref:Secreted protein n=1 Tax=Brachypodium distachyon TaxID=15368 RepID=I1III1_BRADI|nr:hypothetical protein BRADI_4g07660v3 [Brachypodium distachyon]
MAMGRDTRLLLATLLLLTLAKAARRHAPHQTWRYSSMWYTCAPTKSRTPPPPAHEPAGKKNSVSAFFSYPWYSQIELKPAFLVSHC